MQDQTKIQKENSTSSNEIAFAGIVKEKEVIKATEDTLAPKPREHIEFWREEHQDHIKKLRKKEIKCIFLGDSIMQQIAGTSITKRMEWETARIANFSIRGDKVENVLYRIRDYPVTKEVKKVVIAVGTNNLFKDSAKIIESIIERQMSS